MWSRYFKEFILEPRGQETEQNARPQGNPLLPLLGVIEVIHAASKGTLVTQRKGVLTVVSVKNCWDEQLLVKKVKYGWEPIAFNDEDLEGMTRPHDDALVVIA